MNWYYLISFYKYKLFYKHNEFEVLSLSHTCFAITALFLIVLIYGNFFINCFFNLETLITANQIIDSIPVLLRYLYI